MTALVDFLDYGEAYVKIVSRGTRVWLSTAGLLTCYWLYAMLAFCFGRIVKKRKEGSIWKCSFAEERAM